MYLEIFLGNFAVFRVFLGISWKYLNFVSPRQREISEALLISEFFDKIPVRIVLDVLFRVFRFSKASFYALAFSFMTF